MTSTNLPQLADADAMLAQRFVDSVYDDTRAAPVRASMRRLVELGLVEEVAPGQFAETPLMRANGF